MSLTGWRSLAEWHTKLTVIDPSNYDPTEHGLPVNVGFTVNCFNRTSEDLLPQGKFGDVIIIKAVKVNVTFILTMLSLTCVVQDISIQPESDWLLGQTSLGFIRSRDSHNSSRHPNKGYRTGATFIMEAAAIRHRSLRELSGLVACSFENEGGRRYDDAS